MEFRNVGIGGVVFNKKGSRSNQSESLMTLLELIEEVNRAVGFDQVISRIGQAARKIMRAQASSLLLLDEDNEKLRFEFCTGPISEEITGKSIPRDYGFSGWVAEHKLPLIANDIDEQDNNQGPFWGGLSERFTTKNLICAPLLDKDKNLIGVIEAINRHDRTKLTEDDMSIFQILAKHAAVAIERNRDMEKRSDLLSDQDMQLTEIHHRVKNDLALISGIVEVERFDVEDAHAQDVLKNIQSRIKSMAVVYELLSTETANEEREIGTYFEELAKGISYGLSSSKSGAAIDIDADPIILDPYKSLSCGLILNELMLNTYKHAFADKTEGTIDISLKKFDENTITLNYRDDGPGLPDDFDLKQSDSLGFNMINALVKKLEGTIEVINDGGAHFVIQFPVGPHQKKKPSPEKLASVV